MIFLHLLEGNPTMSCFVRLDKFAKSKISSVPSILSLQISITLVSTKNKNCLSIDDENDQSV